MQPRWWWCLRHGRVEPDAGCPNTERLGPYDSPEQAATALRRAQQRNEEWEAADREWDEGCDEKHSERRGQGRDEKHDEGR